MNKLKILFVGDSSGIGTGATEYKNSIAGRLQRQFKALVTNLSKNSAQTKQVIEQISLAQGEFDLIIIMAGTNDVIRFTPLKITKRNLNITLNIAKEKSKHVVLMPAGNIGLAPIFPRPLRWIYTLRAKRLKNVCLELEKHENIIFVNLFNTQIDYAPDKFHPSDEGYETYYKKLIGLLVKKDIIK